MKYHSFCDMEVWQLAFSLSIDINAIALGLPKYEDYALNSQIRRSATSVSSNIAEGFGRKTKKDKGHFYIVSRGSAYETQGHLLYGEAVKYFQKQEVDRLIAEYDKLVFQLNKIIKSLS